MDCFPYLKRIVPQALVKEFKTQEKLQRAFYGKIVEDRRQERMLKREAGTLTESDKGSPNFVDSLLGAQEQGGITTIHEQNYFNDRNWVKTNQSRL